MNKWKLTIIVFCYTCFNSAIYGQWEEIKAPACGGPIDDIVICDNNLFAVKGYSSRTVYLSTDNAASWNVANNGLSGKSVIALTIDGNTLFAGTRGGLFVSTDNGGSWRSAGLDDENVVQIAVSGSNIFAGTETNGVYFSSDSGVSWKAVNDGLLNKNITVLTVNGNTLFAGTWAGLFLTTNNGISWKKAGLQNDLVTSLVVSGSNLFASTDTSGVFLSTDNTESWKEINNGLTRKKILELTLCSTYLFAGLIPDVFLSTDNGTSWKETGLSRWVTTLAASNTDLFAGTRIGGGGPDVAAKLHRLPLSNVSITNQQKLLNELHPIAIRIDVTYDAIKMYYSIKSLCRVQVDLYTLSGVLVAPLASGVSSTGGHYATINKNTLSSGMYILRFKTGFYMEDICVPILK